MFRVILINQDSGGVIRSETYADYDKAVCAASKHLGYGRCVKLEERIGGKRGIWETKYDWMRNRRPVAVTLCARYSERVIRRYWFNNVDDATAAYDALVAFYNDNPRGMIVRLY